ncbi:alpha/beta hydrolase [Novosphingobium sp.]|uniref:alpha/beta fold hydrolase n=1 Tax=Novosphingobium sp. TaxID=1874826 RepID=UPI0022C61889|nr:alpha/beta hydrolase [Novosphingobium sp.]MCZ8019376.1 alpha/beta hydrolase [Novosphingobium sp.]MCZ8035191.1 alpha/beta hydrolase [Novosphingobium sp.]MCZ8050505.1 alpha/beta hydrolase [Novosphingobium sp.]MCZ8058851.1 alpha/beta hydrolase [Novosphingobium sp.]MCZ8232296.1 alpha/beta hydrolase [Novosphingobium sp.]
MTGETIRIPIAGGLTLAADIAGPRGAPTVILGHGGGQTRHSWDKAEQQLAAAGYFAINYDLRGHGDSDWSTDGDYSLEARADDLAAVAAQGSRPYALVGASLGGITAMVAASRGLDPAALVLVDIVPKMSQKGVARITSFMTANPNGFASLEEAADAISAYYPERPRPKDLSGLKKNLRQGDDGRWRWHWDPSWMQSPRGDPRFLLKMMDAADWTDRVPTLLVRGMKSDIVDDDGVDDLRRRIPALEIADIRGAGHMVAGDKNDEFNGAVIEFLSRVMPPR